MRLLSIEEIKTLPTGNVGDCGIYFLFDKGELSYVGASRNVGYRLREHRSFKSFDAHTFLTVPEPDIYTVEDQYIKALQPRDNKHANPAHDSSRYGEPIKSVYVRLPLAEVSQRKREARDIGISLSAYLRLFIDGPAKTIK